MKKPVLVSILAFVALFLLHHDFWNWNDTSLVLGFMPVGLAYHAGYSLVAGLFWYLVTRFAWPHSVEEWAGAPNESEDHFPAEPKP